MRVVSYFLRALSLCCCSLFLYSGFTEAATSAYKRTNHYTDFDIRNKNSFYISFGITGNFADQNYKEPKMRFWSYNVSSNYRFSDKFHGGVEYLSKKLSNSDNSILFLNFGVDPLGFSNFDTQVNLGCGLPMKSIFADRNVVLVDNTPKSLLLQFQFRIAYNGVGNTFGPYFAWRYVQGINSATDNYSIEDVVSPASDIDRFSGFEFGLNVNFV